LMFNDEVVYLSMRNGVKFRLTTSLLGLFPESILMSLFPQGLNIPLAATSDQLNDAAFESDFPNIDDAQFIHCIFDPRLFRFLVEYFKQLLTVNDERSLRNEKTPLDAPDNPSSTSETPNLITSTESASPNSPMPQSNASILINSATPPVATDQAISQQQLKVRRFSFENFKSTLFKIIKPKGQNGKFVDQPWSLVSSDPFPGTRVITTICMLREELDYYMLKFSDYTTTNNDESAEAPSQSRNSLFKRKPKRKPSVTSSRKNVAGSEAGETELSLTQYAPQIRQLCQAFFKAKQNIVTLPTLQPPASTPAQDTTTLPASFAATSVARVSSSYSIEKFGVDDIQLAPFIQQIQFITSLESFTHFDGNSAQWNYREAEPTKSRVVSVAMLQIRDVAIPLPPLVVGPAIAVGGETAGKSVDIDGPDTAPEKIPQQANSIYQSMLQRRPVRKCWWELVSVPTTIEELERLAADSGNGAVEQLATDSVIIGANSGNQLNEGNFGGDLALENNAASSIDPGDGKTSPFPRGKVTVRRRKSGKDIGTPIEIRCWVRKTWLTEFTSI